MHILVGLVLACGLLYWWLVGHWFARVLVFFAFALLLGAIGAGITSSIPYPGHPGALAATPPSSSSGIAGLVLGMILAWPVSGIPIYYRRHKFEVACERQRQRGLMELRLR